MEQIIATYFFGGTGGDWVAVTEARLVEHHVPEFELA